MAEGKKQLRILVIGAHPDDCDIRFGGCAALYMKAGHHVRFMSATNGNTGHHRIGGVELAKRRAEEARKAGEVLGIEYHVMDIQSNEIEPNLVYRKMFIQMIREFRPDLIATHRPNDYHPDHRYTSQLVQDASYAVTVPGVCPLTPHLEEAPVIVYVSDNFLFPCPFHADVVIGIDEVFEQKVDMLHCHTSQVYEWLPYNGRFAEEVPESETDRRAWLGDRQIPRNEEIANRFRDRLIELYGQEEGSRIRYAEAFQACEYGTLLSPDNVNTLFPFLPAAPGSPRGEKGEPKTRRTGI